MGQGNFTTCRTGIARLASDKRIDQRIPALSSKAQGGGQRLIVLFAFIYCGSDI